MDVIWLVDEYLGNGKARHAAFSSKRRAIEVAGKSCDHSSKVILVEWTYCHPLSEEFPWLKSRIPTLWTNSYFVSTVGGAPLAQVRKYIERQKEV